MNTTGHLRATKITIDLGDRGLYRALKVAAAEQDRSVKDIVIEAVRFWLSHQRQVESTLASDTRTRVLEESNGHRMSFAEVETRLQSENELSNATDNREGIAVETIVAAEEKTYA